jgi:hypothetical protein
VSAVELVSPLPPDECIARLRGAVDPECLFVAFGSKPLIGWVFRRRVFLRKRIVVYRNSFQTILIGRFEPHGAGSMFRGTAGLHPIVVVFMAVWFGALVCGGVMYCVAWVQGGLVGDPPLLGLAALALMGVFGALVVRFGRYLARTERGFLVAFLADLLEAPGGGSAELS